MKRRAQVGPIRPADAQEIFLVALLAALVIAGVRKPGETPRTPRPRKVTHEPARRMIVDGRWQPVLRHGKYAGSVRKADYCALLGHLAQLHPLVPRDAQGPAARAKGTG